MKSIAVSLLITSFLLVSAIPAHSQPSYGGEYKPDPHIYDRVIVVPNESNNEAWFAVLEISNITGRYNKIDTEATEHGDVQVEYKTSEPNKMNDIASADRACIVSLPDGVAALPMCVDILEQEMEKIFLFHYVGG